jgi:hypothetical protein
VTFLILLPILRLSPEIVSGYSSQSIIIWNILFLMFLILWNVEILM